MLILKVNNVKHLSLVHFKCNFLKRISFNYIEISYQISSHISLQLHNVTCDLMFIHKFSMPDLIVMYAKPYSIMYFSV